MKVMNMKVLFLDDDVQRVNNFSYWFSKMYPDAYVLWVQDRDSCISHLENEHFDLLCLDNDLGDDYTNGQGYEVAKWMEQRVYTEDKVVPTSVIVHTQNPVARKNIIDCLISIRKKQEMMIDVQSFDSTVTR
jgi:hypothetical protein